MIRVREPVVLARRRKVAGSDVYGRGPGMDASA